jgi:hypothetical protein
MAAKAWSSQQHKDGTSEGLPRRGPHQTSIVSGARRERTKGGAIDEVFFQNADVSLCLLINRRAKTMRVVDFRAGPTLAKRRLVLELAKREGMEKVYTLVERDELQTWVKLGFAKEGNIPGFYKRSDAFLLGCSVDAALAKEPREIPMQSEVRIALRGRLAHTQPPPPPSFVEEEETIEEEDDSAHIFAEKTLAHAKKHAKDLAGKPLPSAKVAVIREADAKKPLEKALKAGRALTAFEAFGRDVERRYFLVTSKPAKSPPFELVASTESQQCFGNAFLELLTGPKNDVEKLATVSALRALCDRLLADGVVSCFSLGPSDDVALSCAFVANGFRRTGLLQNHMVLGNQRKDAIIWSRKLANPADE